MINETYTEGFFCFRQLSPNQAKPGVRRCRVYERAEENPGYLS
jgi:hypothetical protein